MISTKFMSHTTLLICLLLSESCFADSTASPIPVVASGTPRGQGCTYTFTLQMVLSPQPLRNSSTLQTYITFNPNISTLPLCVGYYKATEVFYVWANEGGGSGGCGGYWCQITIGAVNTSYGPLFPQIDHSDHDYNFEYYTVTQNSSIDYYTGPAGAGTITAPSIATYGNSFYIPVGYIYFYFDHV